MRFFHEGHLNIIKNASYYGDVIIGLLTDKAISYYKPIPIFNYNQRHKMVSSIKGVQKVHMTDDYNYKRAPKLKPQYVVHGMIGKLIPKKF